MKFDNLIILFSVFSMVLFACKKDKQQNVDAHIYGEAVDIENNKYITVEIKGKIWFTKNLSSKLFRNGDTIVEARTDDEWETALYNGIPAWCYCNNDSLLSETYGIIYNYHAINDARGLAPAGWHISTSNEWQKLIDSYGGEWNAGYYLKSTTGWANNGNGSNSTRFSALPSGDRIDIGHFMGVNENGWWWTSTQIDSISGNYAVLLPSINNLVNIVDNYGKGYGFCVRCVQD